MPRHGRVNRTVPDHTETFRSFGDGIPYCCSHGIVLHVISPACDFFRVTVGLLYGGQCSHCVPASRRGDGGALLLQRRETRAGVRCRPLVVAPRFSNANLRRVAPGRVAARARKAVARHARGCALGAASSATRYMTSQRPRQGHRFSAILAVRLSVMQRYLRLFADIECAFSRNILQISCSRNISKGIDRTLTHWNVTAIYTEL